jgi:3-keto-5-aminohexanoate cleavage enzyme
VTAPIITAALTGPIATKDDHPGLPVTPEEIAQAAVDAHAAGAAIVHVHLRDAAGRPTADAEIARRTVGLIEDRCPVLVQLSTGVGLDVPLSVRRHLVEVRPRMATLNVCSMTFGAGEFLNPPDEVRRLAARMVELSVKPEIEVYDTGHIDVALGLAQEGLLQGPLQFSVVLGVRGGAPATPEALISIIRRLPPDAVWQAIGIGRHNLALTAIGLAMGGNARTGLEDTLLLRRGEQAPTNTVLVERLVRVAEAIDRPPASVAEAAATLGLALT